MAINIHKIINEGDKINPLSWSAPDRHNVTNKTLLTVKFIPNSGTDKYVNVGIYRNCRSIASSSYHNGASCPSCPGAGVVSASALSEGVCLNCGAIFGSSEDAAKRAEQMFWACVESGMLHEYAALFNPLRSNNYFVV